MGQVCGGSQVDASVLERTEGKAVAHWILERYMGEGQGLEALTRPRPGMVVASTVVMHVADTEMLGLSGEEEGRCHCH